MGNNDNNWRTELDTLINERLNQLLKETKNYNYAIKKSKDKSKAQIWVALALLYDKIKSIETKAEKYNKKIPKDELDKILKIIEDL